MTTPAALRFLIAPLDWGLGHATRCIPIARELIAQGHHVLLTSSDTTAHLLAEELPEIHILPLVGYRISYAHTRWGLYASFPRILLQIARAAAKESLALTKLVREHSIDCVISDNRFGCYSPDAFCVYMTHQLCVRFPRGFGWLEWLVWKIHRRIMTRFDEIWVPDFPGPDNLTGDLSLKRPLPPRTRFVGPLSRFAAVNTPATVSPTDGPDLLVILSGPEPQRTLLERKVLAGLESFSGTAVVVLGQPHAATESTPQPTITLLPHLRSHRLGALLRRAKTVICRGGYSTIMDLVALGRTAVLIPTPGQTEQEYLCARLAGRGMFVMREQDSLDINEAIRAVASLGSPAMPAVSPALLSSHLRELAEKVKTHRYGRLVNNSDYQKNSGCTPTSH